jgi:hypothetical protein
MRLSKSCNVAQDRHCRRAICEIGALAVGQAITEALMLAEQPMEVGSGRDLGHEA